MVGDERRLVFDSKYVYSVFSQLQDKQGFNWTWNKDFECSLLRH